MKLRRRDFLRIGCGLCGAASLGSPSAWAQSEGQDEASTIPQVVLTWGTNGHGEGEFNIPIAIAVNKSDEILVTDFRQSNAEAKSRVQRFDQEGRFLDAFETDPMPGGLALDKDGLLYVTHMMKHKVAVYDPEGKLVREFGKQGSAPGEFDQPGGIAIGRDGIVYVADQANQRVQQLSPQGSPLGAWGKHGMATGEFGGNSSPRGRGGGPHFLAFNSDGDLYTTEASVGRVQKFHPDGTFVLAWGDNEVGPGHFGGHSYMPGPLAVAIDHNDRVWVSSTNHHVQQFTADGHFIRRVGGEGKEPGQFRLPHGLAFDSQHFLYVADARNSRIQKLSI
ncbi:6-bladed beta-propeller [Schlesneria paludicola]|uniref:6-bladed beta-propeller n=1 Tax=Schlesneria paludicola TaxID=360056 RepID=UPI00029B3CA0|nr:6-bladed beta-propeller [Schlesneria paludicola]